MTLEPLVIAMLESTLGALPVPAYANDLRGFVSWQNDAALALAGDRRGLHYSDAVPTDDLPRARETWAAVTLGGETRRRTAEYKMADGELKQLDVIAAPIRREDRIVGVFGILLPAGEALEKEPSAHLSPRQLDVLRLLVQAKSTQQIADELHLTRHTVRNHIAALRKALGARSRLEAALIALRDGLVSLDAD